MSKCAAAFSPSHGTLFKNKGKLCFSMTKKGQEAPTTCLWNYLTADWQSQINKVIQLNTQQPANAGNGLEEPACAHARMFYCGLLTSESTFYNVTQFGWPFTALFHFLFLAEYLNTSSVLRYSSTLRVVLPVYLIHYRVCKCCAALWLRNIVQGEVVSCWESKIQSNLCPYVHLTNHLRLLNILVQLNIFYI